MTLIAQTHKEAMALALLYATWPNKDLVRLRDTVTRYDAITADQAYLRLRRATALNRISRV